MAWLTHASEMWNMNDNIREYVGEEVNLSKSSWERMRLDALKGVSFVKSGSGGISGVTRAGVGFSGVFLGRLRVGKLRPAAKPGFITAGLGNVFSIDRDIWITHGVDIFRINSYKRVGEMIGEPR